MLLNNFNHLSFRASLEASLGADGEKLTFEALNRLARKSDSDEQVRKKVSLQAKIASGKYKIQSKKLARAMLGFM